MDNDKRTPQEPESIDLRAVAKVMAVDNLEDLTKEERVRYYLDVCKAVGLNPVTQPFRYVNMKHCGMKLYATKDCGDQLRMKHGISVRLGDPGKSGDVMYVKATATFPNGRTDEDIGAVCIANARGDQLANALMKAYTKAKRRVALSICGLGSVSDESELETMGGVGVVSFEDAQGAPPGVGLPSLAVVRSQQREQEAATAPPPPPSVPRSQNEPVDGGAQGSPVRPDPDVFHTDDETAEAIGFDDLSPEPPTSDHSLVRLFVKAMQTAESVKDMNMARDKVMELKFSKQELAGIQAAYKQRKRELAE